MSYREGDTVLVPAVVVGAGPDGTYTMYHSGATFTEKEICMFRLGIIGIKGMRKMPRSCQMCRLHYMDRYDNQCCAVRDVIYTIPEKDYEIKRMDGCPLVLV